MANVLLVDDEKVARTLYADFLAGAGHTVVAVGDTPEAREALGRQPFDLVVTDLILPAGDGMELLQHVKTRYPGTEVLVITALDKVDPAVRAIKSGASDYLVKPINPDVLAHAVTRAMTTRSLLRENEQLRRHVSLLEASQRIATTLDKEKLVATATQAFAQVCRADAALLFTPHDGAMECAGSHGVATEQVAGLTSALTEAVMANAADADEHGHALKRLQLPAPFRAAFVVPAVDGDKLLGAVALLFKETVHPETPVSAPYLGRHLGMALRNLGRFEEVEDLVYLDDLTHLFNSRYLELVLDKEFKNATQGAAKPFSLLFSDLDYFKRINDTHGHVVGSKLLVEVARVLKGCVRDNDVVCRWGGDEYVMLLRGTDSGGAFKVAERIRRTIETHHFLSREGFALNVTTCIGVASYPEHANDKDTLLDFADRAMYRGKKATRNIIYMAAEGLEATPASRHQDDGSTNKR